MKNLSLDETNSNNIGDAGMSSALTRGLQCIGTLLNVLDVAVTEPLHLAQEDAAKGKPVLGFSRFLHTDGGVLYDDGRGDIKRPADMCGRTSEEW